LRALASALGLIACLAASPRPALAQSEAGAAGAAVASIPFRKDDRDVGSGLPAAIGVLVFLALLGWGGTVALRRYKLAPPGFAGKPKRVRLIESARIDARLTLYLVTADGKTLLLGRCGDSLIVASELPSVEAPGAAEAGR
jgi:hypothetical protein